MTMTSVAVGPASLAVPNMLGPKRYLQQGPNAPSSGSSKGYETLSKGKKSWSVRLGLSRASSQQRNSVQESVVPPGKHYPVGAGGWGTVSGGSVLAQQMIYAEPWLYGTVRATSSPVAHHHHHHGYHPAGAAPVILVCSCPEFLHGTARDLGSNCRKCGGHRLAGLAAIGGTCRVPTSNVRSRPSLAGMLRPSTDDPYDLMRRSRLLEPKSSRARSISPLRLQAGLQQQQQQQQLQQLQQQQRSQSVVRSLGSSGKSNPKIATVEPMSRTEWFDTGDLCNSATSTGALDRLIDDNSKLSSEPKESDWASKKSVSTQDISTIRSQPGRLVRLPNPNKVRTWQQTPPPKPEEEPISSPAANTSVDSRKSILECDVNPYLLMKNKQQHREDELSDDLSDNALEHEPKRTNNNNNTSSLNKNSNNLFDPSKVKSIERIPNRSSVAAIGGQRIRVFNETREPSDEDDPTSPTATLTRIPIPKISPKRPPRRLKEAKNALKSILKRSATATSSATTATSESSSSSASKFNEPKRKSVLFNVDNVILAPEKPPSPADICIGNPPQRKTSKSSLQPAPAPPVPPPQVPTMPSKDESSKESETSSTCESPIVPEEVVQQPRFITIPNIKSFKQPPPQPPQQPPPKPPQQPPQQQQQQQQTAEAKIVPRVNNNAPATVEKIKIDKFVPSKKQQLQDQHQQANRVAQNTPEEQQPESKTEPEKKSPVETIAKCEEVSANQKSSSTSTTTNLTRSQSERSNSRPTMSAAEVGFVDTMRLSLGRTRAKEDEQPAPQSHQDQTNQEAAARKISFEEARKRVAIKKRESKTTSTSNVMTGRIVEEETIEEPTTTHQQQQQQLKRQQDEEHFVKMRPTSWSPPPGKPRPPASSSNNVCKITVSPPREAPPPPPAHLVHRLQIGSPSVPVTGSRGTSILINGSSDQQQPQQQQTRETSGSTATPAGTNGSHHNKVTINVGGEPPSNGVCNPTVISINSPKSQDIPSAVHHHHHHHRQSSSGSSVTSSSAGTTSGDQKRTLVIFDNYKSNIVIGGEHTLEPQEPQVQQERAPIEAGKPTTPSSKPIEIKPTLKFKEVEESPDSSPRWKQILDAPKSSGSSKEELISKLLEDSLRKARENGEILDESSGEAILKILKQSLLKSSSEADPEYFRPSRSNRDADTIATNMFIEENAYEVIKEPIYEEIPDEPPPLPLSPPPTEDFLKRDRIFFGDELGPALGAYYKPYPEETFKNNNSGSSMPTVKDNLSSKFELLNFIMDSKERTRNGNVALDQEEEEEEDEEEEEEEEEEEDPERDLEALYEQKEMSLGDLSSKSSQISNVSDSSEECNIILTNSPEALKTRTVDIERTDSGVGSESSQASSGRGGSTTRRWRSSPGSAISGATTTSSSTIASSTAAATTTITAANSTTLATPQKQPMPKSCEDCEQRLEPLIIDSVYSPVVCRKCNKKRAERKEIITEIVETEQKYGRDLQIILEEFHRPMLRAGLLTPEQLSAIFLNVEELLEHNQILAEKLKDAVDFAQETNDEDLVRVDLGKIFLESERMLHAFESYCTRQGGASLLLQNLEKEKELLRIFLKVSQMENTVLRRMNLNSFLMVPVQRVTKYPLLLSRLLKATPSGRPEMQELKKRLKQAQTNIELHLEHMNAEAKDITSTKLWRRISIIQNGRRSTGEQDMVNIKLRKMAVEVLEWAHEDSRFVLEGKLLVAQPTDNNWRRGRTVKLAPITAMLVTNGKPNNDFVDLSDDSLFPKQIGVKEATLLLVKEKLGRYSLLREPLYLDKCIVCCETDLEDYFEIQELSSKETFIFKAEDGARTKRWCRTLQAHAQSLGAWRRRRGALPNIMICGVARN